MERKIKIAMLGDSMTDTAGLDCKELKLQLDQYYPGGCDYKIM